MVTVGRSTFVLVFPISPNFAFILRPFWDGPMKKLLVCAEVFPRIWIKSDSWVSWHLLRHLVDRVKYQPPSQTTLRQKPTLVKFPTICAPRNCPEINCTLQSGLVHYIRICGNLNAEGLSGHARNLWTLMNHVFGFAPPLAELDLIALLRSCLHLECKVLIIIFILLQMLAGCLFQISGILVILISAWYFHLDPLGLSILGILELCATLSLGLLMTS